MNEVSVIESAPGNLPALTYTQDQVDLIKRMYAKDATNDELAAFVYASKRMNLDIIARQIHFTKRQGKPVFIVAIDGYRLNAERTGQYAPSREPSFTYDANGKVVSATAYVKKFIGGEWHEVAATAFMEEYKPSDDSSGFMWKKMPHNQLAKCAEALALRRAFPKDLGDTITEDEAAQTREPEARKPIEPPKAKVVDAAVEPKGTPAVAETSGKSANPIQGDRYISDAQRKRFYAIWRGAHKTADEVKAKLTEVIGCDDSALIPASKYEALCTWAAQAPDAGSAQE